MNRSRSAFVASAGAAIATIAVVGRARPASAPLSAKAGTSQPPDHPMTVAMKNLWAGVRQATKGKLDVSVIGSDVLGGSAAIVAKLNAGELQFATIEGGMLAAAVPAAAVQSVGFAFRSSSDACQAFDGALGAYVRGEFAKKDMFAFPKIWDGGMRNITSGSHAIKGPRDVEGFRIGTARADASALFSSLGAQPVPVRFSELYTALQSRTFDGTENQLAFIDQARLADVQPYLCLSQHIWNGYWLFANNTFWTSLSPDVQNVVIRNASTVAVRQRGDMRLLTTSLGEKLARRGMAVTLADRAAMVAHLGASRYYEQRRGEVGSTAYALLEAHTGPLK